MDAKDLEERRFTYHKLSEEDVVIVGVLRKQCRELAKSINAACPDCREKSVAITKIEEASMWANAGIARESAKEKPPLTSDANMMADKKAT